MAIESSIETRLGRLETIDGSHPAGAAALRHARNELLPRFREVASELPRDPTELPPGQWCISPSDFGFHNVLRRPGGHLVFLDFEHAGWDDPAKLFGDF